MRYAGYAGYAGPLLFAVAAIAACDPLPVRPGEAVKIEGPADAIEVTRRLKRVEVPLHIEGCEDFELFMREATEIPIEYDDTGSDSGRDVTALIPMPLLTRQACFDGRREVISLEIFASCRGLVAAEPASVPFALTSADGALSFDEARWVHPGPTGESLLAIGSDQIALSSNFGLEPTVLPQPYYVAAADPIAAYDARGERLFVAIGCPIGACADGGSLVRSDRLPLDGAPNLMAVSGTVVGIHSDGDRTVILSESPLQLTTFAGDREVAREALPGARSPPSSSAPSPLGGRFRGEAALFAVVSTASISVRTLEGEVRMTVETDSVRDTSRVAFDDAGEALAWISSAGVFLARSSGAPQRLNFGLVEPEGLLFDGDSLAVWSRDGLEWFNAEGTMTGGASFPVYGDLPPPSSRPEEHASITDVFAHRGRWVVATTTGVRVIDRDGLARGGLDPIPCRQTLSGAPSLVGPAGARIAIPTFGLVYLLDLDRID